MIPVIVGPSNSGGDTHRDTAEKAVRAVIRTATAMLKGGAEVQPEKNAGAVTLGRAGGIKGGAARGVAIEGST